MRSTLLPSLLLPLILLAAPGHAQAAADTDSEYLQNRAATLNDRIDIAVKDRTLSKRKAARLHLSVGRVQTSAGNLQTRNGTIPPAEVDKLNQQLTDVERILTHQP